MPQKRYVCFNLKLLWVSSLPEIIKKKYVTHKIKRRNISHVFYNNNLILKEQQL